MELLVNMDFDDFQNDANTLEGQVTVEKGKVTIKITAYYCLY